MKDIIFIYSMGYGKYMLAYKSNGYNPGCWLEQKFKEVSAI